MKYCCQIPGKLKWDDPKDLDQMMKEIEENKSKITSLELTHNSIGTECAKRLSSAISQLENLTSVNYRDLFVSRLKEDLPISLKFLMESLSNKKISFLDLSDNAFGPKVIPSFDFFLKTATSLEHLELENNGLGPEGAEMVCNALLQNENIKLKTIKINRNRLEEKGALSLAKVISKMKSLEHLELFQNGISSKGMKEIFLSLKENKNIKIIKINDNFTKESIQTLIEIIPELKNLKIIDISDSLIGNKYGIEFFKIISGMDGIEEVYCNYNEIEDKKAQKEIFEYIDKNKNIKIFEFKGNEVNKALFKQYEKNLKNNLEKFECYSENEEEFEEEEKEEKDKEDKVDKLANEIDNINLNK